VSLGQLQDLSVVAIGFSNLTKEQALNAASSRAMAVFSLGVVLTDAVVEALRDLAKILMVLKITKLNNLFTFFMILALDIQIIVHSKQSPGQRSNSSLLDLASSGALFSLLEP
jgi:hypothetical protein